MKFTLICEQMDGLVLIDKGFFSQIECELLYAMDILLDPHGKSELIFDFPDEEWDVVRAREIKPVTEFCNDGKMIIWLSDSMERECEFVHGDVAADSCKWLYMPTGKLVAVTASELIQCLACPELEMEIFFELDLEEGWYAIWNEGMDRIMYCKKDFPNCSVNNIEEAYD